MRKIPGRYLVQRRHDDGSSKQPPQLVFKKILKSNVALSFWGGIDPVTARVIDVNHPLHGQVLSDSILCVPSARGSCTASQVLLELILNNKAPAAIVLRDVDGLACVGAIIADEILDQPSLPILRVGSTGFEQIGLSRRGMVVNGELVTRDDDDDDDDEDDSIWNENPYSPPQQPKAAALNHTAHEQELLANCTTEAQRMSLNVIFRYARLLTDDDDPTYVRITSAHIDGCTYIGPGGLDFVRRLVQAGGTVAVSTTLNAMSTDRQQWQKYGVPRNYATNAIALGDAYLQLRCQPSFTCAPYLLPSSPQLGDQVAWGESNAVVYANSVLGARTEKYADYLDICCAIAGIVPWVGVHCDDHRRPQIVLDARAVVETLEEPDLELLFPILGHLCGTLSDGKVPLLIGLEALNGDITTVHLKAFCAAFGTTGSSPLIHIAHVTPEARDPAVLKEWMEECGERVQEVTLEGLSDTFASLDSGDGTDERVQLIALGNPHLSVPECQQMADLIGNTKLPKLPNVRVVACVSRTIFAEATAAGHIAPLTKFGVEFVHDTCWCMLLDPPLIPIDPSARLLTNSGKYSHYGPGLTNRTFRFGSLRDCIQAATTGLYTKRSLGQGSANWLSLSTRIRAIATVRALLMHAR